MRDAILEATVKFILKSPENLELALHVEKAESGEAAARNIILQTTADFISGSAQNQELAHRVKEAMPSVRKELCRRVLCAVEDKMRQQKPTGWEIRSSYEDDNKDLMARRSYLAFRRSGWKMETGGRYASGVQFVTDYEDWADVYLGVLFPDDGEQYNEVNQKIWTAFEKRGPAILDLRPRGSFRKCRPDLAKWGQENFMMTATSNLDEIAKKLADGLIDLAKLVDKYLPHDSMTQVHHDDG